MSACACACSSASMPTCPVHLSNRFPPSHSVHSWCKFFRIWLQRCPQTKIYCLIQLPSPNLFCSSNWVLWRIYIEEFLVANKLWFHAIISLACPCIATIWFFTNCPGTRMHDGAKNTHALACNYIVMLAGTLSHQCYSSAHSSVFYVVLLYPPII